MQQSPFGLAYHGVDMLGNGSRRCLALALLMLLASCDGAPDPKLVDHDDAAGNFTAANAPSAPAKPSGTAPAPNDATDTAPAETGGLPSKMLGNWGGLDQDCSDKASIFRLQVEPKRLRFFESVGEIQSLRPAAGGAVVADILYSGEGQSWQRSQTLSLSEGGERLTITGVGPAIVRRRCP